MATTSNHNPIIEESEQDYRDSGIPSTAAIAGHPLHPLLVTFPVALLVCALGTDIGFFLTRNLFWADASLWLIGIGLLTAILAAITGILDFVKIKRVRQRQAGWFHLGGNVVVLLATIVNLSLRWNDPVGGLLPYGLALSLFVSTLLGITGWYGGELVYRHKIAVVGSSTRHTS